MRAFQEQLGALLAVALLASGCTNALYFYETTKLSMTIEGRPDSTQPVTGSIAAKARTAVVVPPKADTEAGSMISLFKTSKASGFLGKVSMTSMLVTGDAATSVAAENKAGAVAEVLIGKPIPSEQANVCAALATARRGPDAAHFAELSGKAWADLSDAERRSLGRATNKGPSYDETFHGAVRDAVAANTCQ
jgi:hypothetical protein